MDHPFAVLGLPLRYDIDREAVERAYLSRAAQIHPDLAGDEDEVAVSAAALNRAKRVLLNDELRADALLTALGGPAKEQDKSLPPGFLMEIMETREAVESAISAGSVGEREKWQRWAAGERARYRSVVSGLFQLGTDAANLRAIRVQLNAWRYVERLIEQLDPRYDPSRNDMENS
jgi:molecular chaperone HscB